MIRITRLLLALLVLGGCRTARPPLGDVLRYRSVDAAFEAHPGARIQAFYIVDGVISVDIAALDTLPAREVAGVEVLPNGPCRHHPSADAQQAARPECYVVMVRTRTALRSEREARRREGTLRIRVRDEATQRYVAAEYYAVALDSSTERSITPAPSGWSRAEKVPAGAYLLVLWSYPCGDEEYLADEAAAERAAHDAPPIIIRAGRRTDAELRIDVRTVEADTTIHPPRCTP